MIWPECLAPCGTRGSLFRSVAADWIPYILNFGGLKASMPGCMDDRMSGRWQDWHGLEWIAASSKEGLEEILTRLTLQEAGGLRRGQCKWCASVEITYTGEHRSTTLSSVYNTLHPMIFRIQSHSEKHQ